MKAPLEAIPKMSIVTPSYNQGKYLEKTILSVLEQGYPNLEYIIIDGGSTDESVEIIRKYQDRLAYWVSEPDRGQSHAINKGFERASGEIFGWLNSDDWYHPGALQAVAEAFAANPEAGAVVGAGDMVEEQSGITTVVEPFPVTVNSLYGAVDRFFAQPSCFFSRKAWFACGPLDECLHLAMDLDLWLRIAKSFRYVTTEKNLSSSLIHAQAKTKSLAPQSLVDACLVIIRHGGLEEGRERLVAFLEELQECRDNLKKSQEYTVLLNREIERVTNLKNRDIYNHKQLIVEKENQLRQIYDSLTWKFTAPVRHAFDVILGAKCILSNILYLRNMFIHFIKSRIIAQNTYLMGLSSRLRSIMRDKISVSNAHCKQILTSYPSIPKDNIILDITVSVVIPTKNAGPEFNDSLKMIKCQKNIKEVEIVVVDSGSEDNTITIAEEFGAKIINIPQEAFTHSYARNLGAENARGKYILFTVQDALFPSELFLYELVNVFKHNNVSAISCAEYPRSDTDLFYRVCCKSHYRFLAVDNCDRIFSLPSVQNYETLRQNGQLSDLACFIERDKFNVYKYRLDYAEDLDLGVRLIKSGHKIAFLGSLKIIHSHNRQPIYYLKRGYADQIFLTHAFPDYPVRKITANDLVREISSGYKILTCLVHNDLALLESPYNPIVLKEIQLNNIDVTECEKGKNDFFNDNHFTNFILNIDKIYSAYITYEDIKAGSIVETFKAAYFAIVDYLIETYEDIDNELHSEFCECLVKQFALICGVNIANSRLNDPNATDDVISKTGVNLTSGV